MTFPTKPRALGVLRELQNSPNRETDDALILKSVASELRRLDVDATVITPEEFDMIDPSNYDLLIPMCESYPRLKRLSQIGHRPWPLLINSPQSVLNCYRLQMTPLLTGHPKVLFPPTEIRCVDDGAGRPPEAFQASQGWWLKRGDVHNTCDRDVVCVRDWTEVPRVLQDFQSREITHFIIQPHLPGDLIKFYGVGSSWFTWFYHDPSQIQGLPFETEALAAAASEAAATVGLEVFGGDAIISPGRAVTLIDINSWPSFAKVRGGAAPQIAKHLRAKLENGASGRRPADPSRKSTSDHRKKVS